MVTKGEPVPSIDMQWQRVSGLLRAEIGEAAYRSWLKPIRLQGESGGTITMSVPTRFMRDWVVAHYADRLRTLWGGENPMVRGVDVVIQPQRAPAETVPLFRKPSALKDRKYPGLDDAPMPRGFDVNDIGAPLDPRYTFDQFVVGKPNEFAYAAARRVAEAKRVPFNPLFLYGGVGLGKTHLMHAIAWHIREREPRRTVIYLSAEKFMYRFIRALREQNTVDFKEQFRSADVLLIDDVQFISGKESTQEEFFHTFNTLVDQGRQIVLSADKSPSDLDGIQERLKSRLNCGLVADIHATTYELRLGILQAKAERLETDIPRKVMEFLAHKISSNVRELEGALNRVVAHAQLVGRAHHPGDHAGGPARPDSRQRPAGHHRRHSETGGVAFQCSRRRHAFGAARAVGGAAPPGGYVSGQAVDVAVPARNRPQIRRPRPHHRDARRQKNR